MSYLRSTPLVVIIMMMPAVALAGEEPEVDPVMKDISQGALRVSRPDGGVVQCPLKHTDVQAQVSGFVARVKVTQTFFNPLDEKIEAVYVFPLPHKSAVDDMTMVIGDRKIVGIIKRRGIARHIYEQALRQGRQAALLEQERPNIFTQSVGNIKPKQEVKIEISYVDVLEYDMGIYTFHFPMVVGPRFIPGGAKGDKPKGSGTVPDTTRVPDASQITPPALKPGQRNGHDISLAVALDAGVPVHEMKVTSHEATITRDGDTAATVKLSPADSIPNKDFVLKYKVTGEKPQMAMLPHTGPSGDGHFMLMIQPKEDERLKQSPPRELCFLVDVSGSMSGRPTEIVKKTMGRMLKLCKPQDTLQVVTFAGQARSLFEKPVPVKKANIEKAVNFTRGLRGGGGTHMLKGIKMAINQPLDTERVRVVVLLTDGFIGNEAEIIAEVGRRCGDHIRFWCIGIGSSPNRFLVDGVARQGGGMSKMLGLKDPTGDMAEEVMMRIHRAQLADIEIDWGSVWVWDTYPSRLPELWAGAPVVVFGRYANGGVAKTITINGTIEGEPATWELNVDFPAEMPDNEVITKVWARRKIEDLMQQTYYQGSPEVEEAVTEIALNHRLMSQYTSFVAVDETDLGDVSKTARPPRRMTVPVPIPAGTRYEGFFGPVAMDDAEEEAAISCFLMPAKPLPQIQAKRAGRMLYSNGAAKAPSAHPVFRGTPGRSNRALGPGTVTAGLSLGRKKESRARGYFGARGSVAGTLTMECLGESDSVRWGARGQNMLTRAMAEDLSRTAGRATEVLKRAEELRKKNRLGRARAAFTCAYLLAHAAGHPAASKAEAAINEINEELVGEWTDDMPALGEKLDIVIRDMSLREALAEIADASGLKIRLIAGSVEDACRLLKRKDLRVTWLDLRHATVVQALDWLLRPVRITWRAGDGEIVVGTSRRSKLKTAWVYDATVIALPSAEQMKKAKNPKKQMELGKRTADEFLRGARFGLGVKKNALAWYAPGRLMVIGDAELHAKARKLFDQLGDPAANLPNRLDDLHKVTSRRATKRKGAMERLINSNEKQRAQYALYKFSWRLLAGAAGGTLDREALTELQIAWRHPSTKDPEIAWRHPSTKDPEKPDEAVTAVRSAWALTEASRALPKNSDLAELAKTARERTAGVVQEAVEKLEETPSEPSAFSTLLFATVARRDTADFAGEATQTLMKAEAEQSPQFKGVVAGLLSEKDDIDRKLLKKRISDGVRGEDATVLLAVACRRAGGDVWRLFRAEADELVGRQPLSGGVVLFIHRLGGRKLPLVTMAD